MFDWSLVCWSVRLSANSHLHIFGSVKANGETEMPLASALIQLIILVECSAYVLTRPLVADHATDERTPDAERHSVWFICGSREIDHFISAASRAKGH